MKEIEVKSPENVLLVLVGNKCDLTEEEEVSIKEGTTFNAYLFFFCQVPFVSY